MTQTPQEVSVAQDAKNQTRGVSDTSQMPAWPLAMTRDQELSMMLRRLQLPGLGITPGRGWELGQESWTIVFKVEMTEFTCK